MNEALTKLNMDSKRLLTVLSRGKSVDILLFLAKYNPDVSRSEIEQNFGKLALNDLKELQHLRLITETNSGLSLTNEGLFQVDGLVSLVN